MLFEEEYALFFFLCRITSCIESANMMFSFYFAVLYGCFIGTTILAGLIGILLWQMLMPCTAYKYWRCREGRIKDQVARFKYVSLTTPTDVSMRRFPLLFRLP